MSSMGRLTGTAGRGHARVEPARGPTLDLKVLEHELDLLKDGRFKDPGFHREGQDPGRIPEGRGGPGVYAMTVPQRRGGVNDRPVHVTGVPEQPVAVPDDVAVPRVQVRPHPRAVLA